MGRERRAVADLSVVPPLSCRRRGGTRPEAGYRGREVASAPLEVGVTIHRQPPSRNAGCRPLAGSPPPAERHPQRRGSAATGGRRTASDWRGQPLACQRRLTLPAEGGQPGSRAAGCDSSSQTSSTSPPPPRQSNRRAGTAIIGSSGGRTSSFGKALFVGETANGKVQTWTLNQRAPE